MADRTHLYTKTQLRDQHRMKPGRDQLPASRYWQGHGYVDLYDLAQAVPMRPARTASPAQAAALAAGRSLAGTLPCACGLRGDRAFVLKHGICDACYNNAMWELQQDEERDRRQSVRDAAADVLARGALVIDVETTGLDEDAEIIEIAVVDLAGVVLFESLVKPVGQVTPTTRAGAGSARGRSWWIKSMRPTAGQRRAGGADPGGGCRPGCGIAGDLPAASTRSAPARPAGRPRAGGAAHVRSWWIASMRAAAGQRCAGGADPAGGSRPGRSVDGNLAANTRPAPARPAGRPRAPAAGRAAAAAGSRRCALPLASASPAA